MGLKYALGATANSVMQSVLSSPAFPLTRYFPRGKSWLYDIQRFAGTRDIKVAFDVGANVGQTANAILRYMPRARIYCFEPVSATYKSLVSQVGAQPNVSCIPQAPGAERGTSTIQLRTESGYNSLLLTADGAEYLTGASEEVEINTVDHFCAANNISQIDILKMDVQGYELKVIEGAARMIESSRVHFVFAEVGFRPNNLEIQMFGDFNIAVAERGFLFSGFYDFLRYGDNKEFVLFANALYTNPKFNRQG
jgi:FkbM family methyltransferase